jgi:hypothetical protein
MHEYIDLVLMKAFDQYYYKASVLMVEETGVDEENH